ncbi:MAG: High molecular weight rubredoxin, partial [Candidatus Delongbacteria bacterium]|nr:High molecular weight rubredoxin [Candidatus Delongbacteria bacterium]
MGNKALLDITYGMYIVGTAHNKKTNALLVSSLVQVNFEPDIIAISIMKSNHSHDMIKNSLKFSASIISRGTPIGFIKKFGINSGKNEDKLKDIGITVGQNGCPIVLDNTVSYFEADVLKVIDLQKNTMFIARV